ncbi:hypothetical protein GCM10011412_10420 [Maribacter cobaltidurans]|nr:hypothetical protein GCM10011412_10420 [Maribacter cobaltidurans]
MFHGIIIGQTVIKGTVTDADTGLPLPYVNIGFIERGLGIVSEEDGTFNFSFDSTLLTENDTLKISSLAYKEYRIPFTEVLRLPKFFEVKLEPEIISLNEVVLTADKRKRRNKTEKMVGYSNVGKSKIGSWEGKGALGGELVTKIYVSKKERQLNTFYFYILENKSDSLLVRINIYDGKTIVPERKLISKNIFYTIKTKKGKVGVDLRPYNIIVHDDFSIGIELIKSYGNEHGLIVAGDDRPGVSFRRYASQGNWKRHPKDALTYFLSTSLLEESEDEEDVVLLEENLVSNYSSEQLLQGMGRNIGMVSGFVFKEGEKVRGVKVQNLLSKEVTTTDESGRYTIKAKVGDQLEFSYPPMQSELRTVLETTFAINVALEEQVFELEEVTVTSSGKKKRTQEELFRDYDVDKDIIKTSFGIYSKESQGYDMQILDESEFSTGAKNGATNLVNLIRGQITGFATRDNELFGGTIDIYLRQSGSTNRKPAVYEVDGHIVPNFPNFIDVSQVKRIAVLSGMAAVAKYGSIGNAGVIIINTKSGNFLPTNGNAKIKKPEMVKAISEEEARRNWPDFLKEIYASKNIEEAQTIYNTYEPKYGTNANFNIDALNYFLEFWKEESFTDQLLNKSMVMFKSDGTYLKSLAFLLDKYIGSELAVEIYKKLFVLKSNSPQSYRDLAHAYSSNGMEARGKNLYAKYYNLNKEGYFSKPPEALQQVVNTEVKTLLDIKESEVDIPLSNLMNVDEDRIRILLEWNDDTAELDFQFIDNNNLLSLWANANDGKLGESLVSKGYTSKDFFIYGDNGTWKINCLYKGNRSGLATYLKITVSTDYGTESQKDAIHIFRMDIKNVNRELLEIPLGSINKSEKLGY